MKRAGDFPESSALSGVLYPYAARRRGGIIKKYTNFAKKQTVSYSGMKDQIKSKTMQKLIYHKIKGV